MKKRLILGVALCILFANMFADEYKYALIPGTQSCGTVEVTDNGNGTFTLEARPSDGWEFDHWSNLSPSDPNYAANPYPSFTPIGNTCSLQAVFSDRRLAAYRNSKTDPAKGGTVRASRGACDEDWVLTATPDEVNGWVFLGWDDDDDGDVDNISNPRDIKVSLLKDTFTYKAIFEEHIWTQYHPTCNNHEKGTVTATQPSGYCEYRWHLTATSAAGYSFVEWNDGNTNAERDIEINKNLMVQTYTATFVPTCSLNTPIIASVPGLDTYEITRPDAGCVCSWQLEVTPAYGYIFLGWDDDGDGEVDSSTDNPRIVTSNNSGPDTYTPIFMTCSYKFPDVVGTSGSVVANLTNISTCDWQLTAIPAEGWEFAGWSDRTPGDPNYAENPRSVNLSIDEGSFVAIFSDHRVAEYTKYSKTDPAKGGTVSVSKGTCDGEWILTATPDEVHGWTFLGWDVDDNDGVDSKSNPLDTTVNLSKDTFIYKAIFEDRSCALYEPKYNNPIEGGTVNAVAGTCACDWILTATPTEGYAFLQWDDCNYLNPRPIEIDKSAGPQTYTAHFIASDAYIDSWTETDIVVGTKTQDLTPTNATIRINGVEIDPAHTNQDPDPVTGEVGLWTLPGGLNDYAGQPMSIIFYDNSTGQPVSVVTGTVPYVSTGSTDFSDITPTLPDNTDVEVVDGTITFDDDEPMVLGALTVYADAKAVIPTGKDVTFTHIYLRGDGINHTYPQLVVNGSIHNLNSNTIYYDYKLDYASFYPLAVPYDVTCANISTKTGRTASYEVQWYNGEDRAANAHAWTVFDDQAIGATLRAGTGYIVFAVPYKWNGTRHATVDVRFPMVVNLESGEQAKTTHISEYGGEWTSPSNRNWNFIGSPYLANYRHHNDAALMEGTYEPGISTGNNEKYEYNNDGVRYITSSSDGFLTYTQTRVVDQDLVAFNSYFIQAATTGDLSFPLSQRAQNAPRRIRSTDVPQEIAFGIVLSGANQTDYTGLLYGETFTPDYELNADLVKVHGSSPTLALYSLAGTDERAFNALSLDAMSQPVPLGFKHATAGLMTFAFDTAHYDASILEAVMLTDYATGRVVNLLDEDYSFTTTGTEENARFVINAVLAPRVTTGVDNRTVNSLQPDGVYDLLGRRVSPDMLQQGVYIIIENGQSRKEVIR